MDWAAVGARIRKQRELLGLTREQLAEQIDITPKFCADIELGIKGMSVPTLCKLSECLSLKTDYILFGKTDSECSERLEYLIQQFSAEDYPHVEKMLNVFSNALKK